MKRSQSKLPKAFNPETVIRLSERDRRLVLTGLSWIGGYFKLSANGERSGGSSLEWLRPRRHDPGVFNQDLMDGVLALHAKSSSLAPNGRIRFGDSRQVAACALAVRVAVRRHKHGHTHIEITRIDFAAKRLLRRLETVRKRAKRADLQRFGPMDYRQRAQDWQRFLQWLRVHLLNCGCGRRRWVTQPKRWRAIVDTLVTWVRAELINSKQRLPDEPELRRLIRLALCYARRGRTQFNVKDLLLDKGFASVHLAAFVTHRVEKASYKEAP